MTFNVFTDMHKNPYTENKVTDDHVFTTFNDVFGLASGSGLFPWDNPNTPPLEPFALPKSKGAGPDGALGHTKEPEPFAPPKGKGAGPDGALGPTNATIGNNATRDPEVSYYEGLLAQEKADRDAKAKDIRHLGIAAAKSHAFTFGNEL